MQFPSPIMDIFKMECKQTQIENYVTNYVDINKAFFKLIHSEVDFH